MSKATKSEQYWASVSNPAELLDLFDVKIKAYYDDMAAIGLRDLLEKSYRAYYGAQASGSSLLGAPLFASSKLGMGGRKGEKTKYKANHFRNILQHLHQLVTQQKKDLRTRAANSDAKSQIQTILGDGCIDYYFREKSVSSVVRDAVEEALISGEAFAYFPWNPNIGAPYAVDPVTGRTAYEGDLDFSVLSPLEAVRDITKTHSKAVKWYLVPELVNRWDLMAEYPAMKEELKNTSAAGTSRYCEEAIKIRPEMSYDDEVVVKWSFYHEPTPALPRGRMTVFVENAILFDDPAGLPYEKAPIARISPNRLLKTIYGYSVAFDLLAPQDGIDELNTILMSNNKTFGYQSIWARSTDSVSVSQLSQGMNLIKSDEKPEPLSLTKSAAETYTYLSEIKKDMELLGAVPAAARGNPAANLRSGNALAIVISQSIQFINGLEESLNTFLEDIGMGILTNLRSFSTTRRVMNIVGKSQRAFVKDLAPAEDLSEIHRVVVEQTNPLSKTAAGRIALADNLLQQGFLKSPEEYFQVLTTGRMDTTFDAPQYKLLAVQAENEALREGRPVRALITDDHAFHARQHFALAESPDVREDPEMLSRVLAHGQEHLDMARITDPAISMVMGHTVIPQAMPSPGPVAQAPAPQTGAPDVPDTSPDGVQAAAESIVAPTPRV